MPVFTSIQRGAPDTELNSKQSQINGLSQNKMSTVTAEDQGDIEIQRENEALQPQD